ncbi:hypothetical protein H4R23_005601 [Coemansia sp. Cherry 401B]|nr:hypothetical protein IWW54_005862 [Coemansia sp. RSA 2705]KAJ2309387.1 hypothetical protein IWW52_005703 [Coemansia sp. RSA 2704]KAJ2715416.1 hypothetical protein H4R23_005601 [Coemansia sp. Cherry 401B]
MFVRPKKPVPEPHVRHSLADLGYHIDPEDGLIRSTRTNQPYAFSEADKRHATELYYQLVHPASRALLALLTDTLHMDAIPIPSSTQPHCFVYATPRALSSQQLAVLIVGHGTFAGVWAWNTLLKHGVHQGSMVDYIRALEQRGIGVLVLNPNMNVVAPDGVAESHSSFTGRGTEIRGSETADEHVGFVWSQLLRDNSAVHRIAFVAYNTAGNAVVDLLRYDYTRFVEKAAGVAFIESTHSLFDLGRGSLVWLAGAAQNWQTQMGQDAGDTSTADRLGCPVIAVENTTESREMTPALCREGIVEYLAACLERGPLPNAADFGPGQDQGENLAQAMDELSDSDNDGGIDSLDSVEAVQGSHVREDGYIGWD